MNGVHAIESRPIGALAEFVPPDRLDSAVVELERLRRVLRGRRLVHVTGDDRHKGGVYEILRSALPYFAGVGIDVAWFDVETAPEARAALEFAHVLGHGNADDDVDQLASRVEQLAGFGARGVGTLLPRLRPSDVTVLHDTQTALLVPEVRRHSASAVWHAHIGTTDHGAAAPYWSIFGPSLTGADRCIFYLEDYVPSELASLAATMRPTVDPSTTKNSPMESAVARLALHRFVDSVIAERAGSLRTLSATAFVACQVSRWDPLKDMPGVVEAFGLVADHDSDFHGVVVGTEAQSESERDQLQLALSAHARLPNPARSRVHVLTVGASGTEIHDRAICALQASADVALQKSLREGFGLTVTEAMLRKKAVVASRVGGIPHQIKHGVTGFLLDEPSNVAKCSNTIQVLADPNRRITIGEAARRAALDEGTVDRYVRSLATCLAEVADS